MNAAVVSQVVESPIQQEMFGGRPMVKTPAICRRIIVGTFKAKSAAEANTQVAEHARQVREQNWEEQARIARIPIVPSSWLSSNGMQVTPEEAGDRKSGRPRLNIRRSLTVTDLDASITYLQRRTREVSKIVKGAQPDAEHTSKIVTSVIKDAVRKLTANLPEDKREAIDEVVAKL